MQLAEPARLFYNAPILLPQHIEPSGLYRRECYLKDCSGGYCKQIIQKTTGDHCPPI
jgi:hypothetical protein